MSLPRVPDLPDALLPAARRAGAILDPLLASGQVVSDRQRQALARVCACSDFAWFQLSRCPGMLPEMLRQGVLERPLADGELAGQLRQRLAGCTDMAGLMQVLRRFRNACQVRIIWRDINRLAALTETCRDLSALADACIREACAWLHGRLCQQYGTPTDPDGRPLQLLVIGMGKLGGRELNLSSDVDLIFAFAAPGETRGGPRQLDNQSFFTRLGQQLIEALDRVTADGFVFRVDMRLRPFGSDGPLVSTFAALERYLQEHGRDWERYAMIKARVICADPQDEVVLQAFLRPFVYRQGLDFSSVGPLRDMKRMIGEDVRRKGMEENIKLGNGGIREVEFIAQVFQLIYGGQDNGLQQRSLLAVLALLEQRGYLAPDVVAGLVEGYSFLRYVEHALQTIDDQQTHSLPRDELNRLRVAVMMGFTCWDSFSARLEGWRQCIAGHFHQLIARPPVNWAEAGLSDWRTLWLSQQERAALAFLQQAGFRQPEVAWQHLVDLRESAPFRAMQALGRERLDDLMPCLLEAVARQPEPDTLLVRALALVEAIARRSHYVVLLLENRPALERLLQLFAASQWVTEQIVRYPLLLDGLLDARRLFSPPSAAGLDAELRKRLFRVPADDLEQQMEVLRQFKRSHRLRVAASEIAGTLPLMKVSDYLTWLAEAILQEVFGLAWQQMVARHGTPYGLDGQPCAPGFLVVGYGKLGGIELGHESDLDLVFIHAGDPARETAGPKPLDSQQFFIRLAQRMIHLLSTQTNSGKLYEVDMQLRPSGSAGLLVSSIRAFARYQKEEAWTWEHQALVRARPLVGSERLKTAFQQVRDQVLGQPRGLAGLRQKVSDMRTRMRDSFGTRSTRGGLADNAFAARETFCLKQDAGGIVDIEFMVQYAVLAWSHRYPVLLRHTDNIRILDSLAATGLLTATQAQQLQQAYQAYRVAAHRLSLQKQPGKVCGESFPEERRAVMRIWRELGLS